MRLIIILPTYNEADNIKLIIKALQKEFIHTKHDCHILVVDDNSPDGTGDFVKQEIATTKNVHLLTGEKKGLGEAYVRGIDHAIYQLDADAIFEMDADFSHNPKDIHRLIHTMESGAEFVIGSRYIKNGSIPKEWGFSRRLISIGGNLVARYVAGIYRTYDCTAGFRLISTSLLKKIDLKQIKPQGYAFQVALLHEAVLHNAIIKEIPVDFTDRKYGQSKLGITDIIEFIIQIGGIRLRNFDTFLKFCTVGFSGVFVNLSIFTFLIYFDINKFIASPVAIEISIMTNFLLNNYWTFSLRQTKDRIRIKGLKFNVVSIISLLISYLTFVFLAINFPDTMPQIHQLIGIIPATFVNYFLNSYWTFSET